MASDTATLTFANIYVSRQLGAANNFAYEITGNLGLTPVHIQNLDNREATAFNVNDILSVEAQENLFGAYVYMGSYEGGLVLRFEDDWQGRNAILVTNNVYPDGALFGYDRVSVPVCFVKGTLITTRRGHVAIEDIVEGDSVQGSTGWRTVKWVGWRKYGATSFRSVESKSRIAPVRIKAQAIADNIPSSDLLVSAWHHLFVDGKLVRAGDLVNGTTIVQEMHVTEVAYYHIELDQFDVVMAHGLYSESWADGGNRDFFQNADVTLLRPEDMKRRRAPRPGFDHLVLRKGKALTAIQQRLVKRAKAITSTESNGQQAA